MSIPTQFYEQDFIDFEDYMKITGDKKESTKEEPHANSEYVLKRFEEFENWRKRETKKMKQRQTELKKKEDCKRVKSEPKKKPLIPHVKSKVKVCNCLIFTQILI